MNPLKVKLCYAKDGHTNFILIDLIIDPFEKGYETENRLKAVLVNSDGKMILTEFADIDCVNDTILPLLLRVTDPNGTSAG